jgi:murein DD-endopeptidase MepM/ murein hydrolase activator NlpD
MTEKLRLQHMPVDPWFPITARPGEAGSGWAKNHRGFDWGMKRDAEGNPLLPIHGANVYSVWEGRVVAAGLYMEKVRLPDDTDSLAPGPLGLSIWHMCDIPGFGKIRFAYCHLRQIFVQEGQIIKPGEVIGLVGNSGFRRDGKVLFPHLHWMPEKFPEKSLLS